jgi:phospholipase/carboxylesterase
MPDAIKTRRTARPTEGFVTAHLPAHPERPVRLFLPSDYQPKYAYPLVVLLHGHGGDEETAARFAPQLSRRNYIAACPRGGLALGPGTTGRHGFGWSDSDTRLKKYLLGIVAHTRREYHVHAERVYLVGIGEGAAVAYRLGLALADRVAGVVALNGRLPQSGLKAIRGLRVFVGHGANNPAVRVSTARKAARMLNTAGAEVRFQAYPTTHRIDDDMLRDVNRWIMGTVNTEPEPTTED